MAIANTCGSPLRPTSATACAARGAIAPSMADTGSAALCFISACVAVRTPTPYPTIRLRRDRRPSICALLRGIVPCIPSITLGSGYWFVLLVVLLTGCAQFAGPRPVTSDQIDTWLAQQNYGSALTALANIPATAPQRDELLGRRAQVLAQAQDYEKAELELVRNKEEEQDFAGAFTELRIALANYPQSELLAAEQQRLLPQQQKELREINDQLLITRVQYLIEALPLQGRLAQLDPDFPMAQFTDMRAELDRSSGELLECGQHSMREGKLARAELCLTLAKRIQDTQLTRTALTSLEKQQTQRKQATRSRVQRSQEKTKREQVEQLLTRANEALARDDLPGARHALDELLALDAENTDALTLRDAVNSSVAARSEELLRQGNQLYRSGNIEQAKRTWEQGLRIDPENTQLLANVQRAERVLQNLQEMQRKESKGK